MKRLEREEARKLTPAVGGISRDVVEFLGRTGARISEALLVRIRDVDVARGIVSIPTLKRRGGRRPLREVRIGREYASELAGGRTDPEAPVFVVSRQRAWKAMRRAAERLGLDGSRAHPHALRHGFAIANVEAGIPVAVLRKLLGHATLKTTTIYTDEVEASRWMPASAI